MSEQKQSSDVHTTEKGSGAETLSEQQKSEDVGTAESGKVEKSEEKKVSDAEVVDESTRKDIAPGQTTVLAAIDGSENAENAFRCKFQM